MKIVTLLIGIPSLIREVILGLLRQNRSALAASLRQKLHGGKCFIDTQVIIDNSVAFESGISSALYHGCYILNRHGKFAMGENSHLGAYCYVNACYGKVTLGDHVAVGPGTKIFSYSNNYRANCNVSDEKITADVMIGDNVFIGSNCAVLPGSQIGDNTIIGAGSVVKGKLDGNAIYAGVPCRLIRKGWYSAKNNDLQS